VSAGKLLLKASLRKWVMQRGQHRQRSRRGEMNPIGEYPMNKLLILSLLVASASAQIATGVTGSVYEPSSPDLKALIQWQAVPGAQSYNVYRFPATSQTANDCPAQDPAGNPNDIEFPNIAATSFLDNPNPTFASIPVTDHAWEARGWCYWVETNMNGTQVGESRPVMVWIGESGYVTLTYWSSCAGGDTPELFPYTGNQIKTTIYYRDSNNVNHVIPSARVYGPDGQPTTAEEWEWKIPVRATDGTMVPWTATGTYYYEMVTPDGGVSVGDVSPRFDLDYSFYHQTVLHRVKGSEWCPTVYGEDYDTWQNVAK
jgi:hypothetical protein